MASNSRMSMAPGASGSHHYGSNAANPQLSVADQLMQLDSAITSTLHEIDANFAKAHQIVTSTLLPAVKLYGQHTARTWHSAKLWQEFFILAANIGSRQHQQGESGEDDGEQYEEEEEEEDAESTLSNAHHTSVGQTSRRTEAADESGARSFESVRYAHASSPAKSSRRAGSRHQTDEEPSWANMESPFERLKKELAQQNAGDESGGDESMSQAEIALRRHRAQVEARRNQQKSNEEEDEGQVDEAAQEIGKIHLTDLPMIRSPAKLRGRNGTGSGQTPRLLNRVLQSEQKKADAQRTGAGVGESTPAVAAGSRSTKWNGLADLSKTPLSVRKGKGRTPAKGKGKIPLPPLSSDDSLGDSSSDDSLAWPPGMSPPVTLRLSMPRSRFEKTPAKEAAKILMDDLLRTAENQPRDWEKLLSAKSGQSSMKLATPLRKGPLGRVRKSSTLTDKSTPVTSSNRAALLLDEGEDGEDSAGGDLGDLTAGPQLDSILSRRIPTTVHSESDSESDEDESEDEDSEEEYTRRAPPPSTAWTDSSLISRHDDNIDNDTLFGIGGGAGGSATKQAPAQAKPRGPSDEFRLRGGQLEDTVRGGKLLEERDLTYSAPSPTPAPFAIGRRSGSGGG